MSASVSFPPTTLTASDGIRDARSIAEGMILGGVFSAALEFSDDAYGHAAAVEFRRLFVTLHGKSITIERFVKSGHPGTDVDTVSAGLAAAGGDVLVLLTTDVAFGKSLVSTNHITGVFSTVMLAPQLYSPINVGVLNNDEKIIGIQVLDLPFGPNGLQRAYSFSQTMIEYSAVSNQDGQTNFKYIEGKATAEVLTAGLSPAIFKAGGGADTLMGSTQTDYLFGEAGNDSISGASGMDTLLGGLGSDRLYGGSSRDWLYGGDDVDGIFGQAGKDLLFGGAGNDLLFGGDDTDILNGGAGADYLDGGANADRFVFSANSGRDRVAHFSVAEGDRLQISASHWTGALTATQVVSRFAHIVNGEVQFDFGNGNTITLLGNASLGGLAAALDIL